MDGRQGESLGPDEVRTLRTMTEVSLAAVGADPPRVQGRPDVDELSRGVLRAVEDVRAAVLGLEVLGPTRFAPAKRLVLRAARLFTHRLADADRRLADGLEAMALVQAEQLGHAQRMSDSLRALVVSADLAMTDALVELGAQHGDVGPAVTPAAGEGDRIALLEARVAELEARLAAVCGQTTVPADGGPTE